MPNNLREFYILDDGEEPDDFALFYIGGWHRKLELAEALVEAAKDEYIDALLDEPFCLSIVPEAERENDQEILF
jgi:ABC-type lipopolysaccharide export system ATPase subunit